MIIERITAIRVVPPKLVTTRLPVARMSRDVEATYVVGSGERQVAEGATGNMLDVSYEELEVDFYSPRDLILYAEQAQLRPSQP